MLTNGLYIVKFNTPMGAGAGVVIFDRRDAPRRRFSNDAATCTGQAAGVAFQAELHRATD
jgi:hypothetical protein